MTLHRQAAKIATKGRNGDSMLVHMSPEEVGGLHALALSAYGKPLTINPVTGVVEASLLKRLLPTIAGAVVGSVIPGAGTWGSAIAGGITSGFANGWKPRNILGGMLGGGSGRELVNRFAMAGTPVAPTASAQGGGAGPVTDEFGDALPKSARNVSAAPAPATTATGVAREAAATAAKGNATPVKPTFKNVGEGIRSVLMDEKAREQFTKDNFWPIAAALGSYAMIPDKYNGPKNTPTRFWKQKLHRGTKVNPLWQTQQGQPYWTDQYWEDGQYTTEDPFAKGYASGGDVVRTEEPLKSIPDVMNTSVPVAAAPAQQYYSTDYKSSYHDPLMEYIDAVNARRKPVPKTSTPVNTGPGTGPGTGNPNPDPRGDGSARDDDPIDNGGGTGGTPVTPVTPIPVTPTDPIEVTRPPRDRDDPGYTGGGIRDALQQILPTYPIDQPPPPPVQPEQTPVQEVYDENNNRVDRDLQPYGYRGLPNLIDRVLPQYNVPDIIQPVVDYNPQRPIQEVYDEFNNRVDDVPAEPEPEPKPEPEKERGASLLDTGRDLASLSSDVKNIVSDRAIDAMFDLFQNDADRPTYDEAGNRVDNLPEERSAMENRFIRGARIIGNPLEALLHPIDTVTGLFQGTPVKPIKNSILGGLVGVDENTTKTPEEIAREQEAAQRRAQRDAGGGPGGTGGAGGTGVGRAGNGAGRGGNSITRFTVTPQMLGMGPAVDPSVKKGKAGGGMIGYAQGGIASLGGYSDGGRLLRGPGDGVSDDIPASIHRNDGTKQEARLADGEFVFPARIVSEIGNGSTEAGAKKLYDIMERIQRDRSRSLKDVAFDSNAERHFNSLMA